MSFEKTQKGNPYKLTLNQHIFPTASIYRFIQDDGLVRVFDKRQNKKICLKASDSFFCAKRSWNQRAEHGYMKKIEDDFQELVNKIINKQVLQILDTDKIIVNRFFNLWRIRAAYKNISYEDIQLSRVDSDNLTKDQEEILESKGCSFIRAGGMIPARDINGLQMQFLIDCAALLEWGIIYADEGEFIVPDFPELNIIPILSNLCLVANSKNGIILKKTVIEINCHAVETSKRYYFAKDISKCPLE